MKDDVAELARVIDVLVKGWAERIEYRIVVGDATEKRAESRWHPPLLIELRCAASRDVFTTGKGGGGSGGKPGSRPPGSLIFLDLIREIRAVARKARADWNAAATGAGLPVAYELRSLVGLAQSMPESDVRDVTWTLKRLTKTARIQLGYEIPSRTLAETVCGACGGVLKVADDASSDVWCSGTSETPPCGQVYPKEEWVSMLFDAA
ncbi:hypothetical protein ACIRPT_02700 [Streptomyces sp. NPDC101227]|uniref:hypothetical protein n=1 Tax=Streptomyces sp. NPDC101227 TaxID=3366136 RepID=UPI00380EBB0F